MPRAPMLRPKRASVPGSGIPKAGTGGQKAGRNLARREDIVMNSKQCDAANETAAEFTWLARSEKCDFVEDLGGGGGRGLARCYG